MELRERFCERTRHNQERRCEFYLIACRFDAPPALVRLAREDLTRPSGSALAHREVSTLRQRKLN